MTKKKEILHDFNDGNGKVKAHRHINPDKSIGGWVSDTVRVSGTACVSGNARVSGNACVSGNAWGKSPLYIQGTKHSLTVCKYGFLTIGCLTYEANEWVKTYKEICKKEGYTPTEITEYGNMIHFAVRWMKLNKVYIKE